MKDIVLRKAACGVMPYLFEICDDGVNIFCVACGAVSGAEHHDDDCEVKQLQDEAKVVLTKRGWELK